MSEDIMRKNMGQRRICLGITVLVLAIYGGNLSLNAEGKSAITQGARIINAVRTETPPVIDGKLDDGCWQKTKPITDFLSMNSDQLVSYQSNGYICYDESRLYIGMKCLMPKGVKPGIEKGSPEKKPHDTYVFSDDIVEIMIDPGRAQFDYYQLVISAYGSTYDSARTGGGTQNDPTWNGDWTSAAHIEDGYWSMEMSVPFHNLGISPEVGSTWGINLCRETKRPKNEYSSIAIQGRFNHAKDFAVLKGLNVDFNKYLYQIGPAVTQLDLRDGKPIATFSVPIKNTTGKTREVKIERWHAGSDGKETVESKVVTLAANETTSFSAEELEVEALSAKRTDAYVITSVSKTKKIVVSDSKDGTVLSLSLVKRAWFCETMRVDVEDPWKREMSLEKTSSVKLKVHTLLAQEQLKKGELVVTLGSKETGKVVASKSFTKIGEKTEVTFPTQDIPWGAYEVSAVFKDFTGEERISSRAVATVLPGGKQSIKVLNNLVSELMDAKERGLLGEKEIEFMNPRDGWVFFSISGSVAHATLDSETKPLAELFLMYAPATEGMRLLRAGRHVLHLDGEFDHIVVRAIPELMYSCHRCGFDWEFLRKDVLSNSNTILGNSKDERAMKEWTAMGKKWITFAGAPSHGMGGSEFIPADKYYDILSEHGGFKHPLLSGIMVDQIGSSPVQQKIEIARTLSRMVDDPKFQGKEYRPWYEGAIFGSEGDNAFMKVVLGAGWPFSFYWYLVDSFTEEKAKEQIQDVIVKTALNGDRQIPGALRRTIVTLGYLSHFPAGLTQNIDPGVNFKVLMQMQMETLANDPALFGLYGILWYYSSYVDEENARWAGRLFRHYGIEGKTTKLTNDPYQLSHIKNPDFEQGTKGWTITQSEPGAVSVKSHTGYGGLQSRYLGGSHGDKFLVTKRSAKSANKFSQEIKNLIQGRAYSMKMITADYGNIIGEKSVKQKDAISIQLDNVELIPGSDKNYQWVYPSNYSRVLGKFNGKYPAYMNFHWYVFRAKGATAKLTVSDWVKSDNPGAPTGQEIMYNFIEIQPYLE